MDVPNSGITRLRQRDGAYWREDCRFLFPQNVSIEGAALAVGVVVVVGGFIFVRQPFYDQKTMIYPL